MAFFGFGQASPFAEADQKAQDQQAAFQGMRDNLPALGLIAGLSMLARNNGNRSVGQLVGAAGGDALNAYGTWQKMQEAKKRLEMEDQWKKDEREYQRGQDALRNALAERKFGLEEANADWSRQMDMRRLSLQGAQLALSRANAARAAAAAEEAAKKGVYHKELGGMLMPDGSVMPVKFPEGFTPPGAGSEEFAPIDANARKELASLGESDLLVGDMIDKLEASKGKGGTGFLVGNLPATLAGRVDPEGIPLRSAISNFSSQVMNAISGAAVSETERKRLEGFLPTTTDDYDTLMAKMRGYQDFLRTKATNWQKTYGPHARIGKMRVMGGSGGGSSEPALPEGFTAVN